MSNSKFLSIDHVDDLPSTSSLVIELAQKKIRMPASWDIDENGNAEVYDYTSRNEVRHYALSGSAECALWNWTN